MVFPLLLLVLHIETMANGSPQFPPEVLELFVDRIADFTQDRAALQACSLVSHAFRNRAHHHLFSSIRFTQRSYSIATKLHSELQAFCELATSGLTFTMTTLLFHVQSFALVLNGSVFDAYTTLSNENLTEIMRLLRKHSQVIHSTIILGSAMRIFWPYLSLRFRKAFTELCQVPSMSTLHLQNICSVPATLLSDTNINDVRLHQVTLLNPLASRSPFNFLWNVSQLHSLDIDHSFPFPTSAIFELDIGNQAQVPFERYRSSFSNIRRLRYTFYDPDDFQKFHDISLCMPALEEVCVVFSANDFHRGLRGRFSFNELPSLRALAIHHESLITIGLTSPLFKVLETIKSISVPPTLESIELGFQVHTHPPWMKGGEFFPETQIWSMLDKALAHSTFDKIKTVELNLHYMTLQAQPWTFDERFFDRRCRKFLPEAFPLLTKSKSKELIANISVQVAPLAD